MDRFKHWGWDDTWTAFEFIAVVAGVAIVLTAITADHRVRSYYLDQGDGGICVKAEANWTDDPTAFCTDDSAKALDALKKLNDGLR